MSEICPQCNFENNEGTELCASCKFPLVDSRVLANGRYRMTKPYVFSSFRAVYQVEDVLDDNKKYSVREFLPKLSNRQQRDELKHKLEEIISSYKDLEHKNLAGIRDFFVEGNYFYIVYDYVNGMDMTKYLSAHKIVTGMGYPEQLVTFWALQMCDLIEYLHHEQDEPVFIEDFKPAGIVFEEENEQLVFIDIGLSKYLSAMGMHYLITEDFLAYRKTKGKSESFEWDLFCFGNFIYYLLTGIDLLRAPDDIRVNLKAIRPDISDGMIKIVEKAIGKDYISEYEDIWDIRSDLLELAPPLPLKAFDFYHTFVSKKNAANVSTSWPEPYANAQRSGISGYSPKIPFQKRWSCELKPSQRYSIFSGTDHVYAVSKEGQLYAIEHKRGKVEWKTYITKNLVSPGITVNETIYLITPFQELIAIDHGQDKLKWKLELESSVMCSPVYFKGYLFVALYNGNIYAVSTDTGKIVNKYKVEGNILVSPSFAGTTIYVASLNRMLRALNINNGEILWEIETEAGFTVPCSINQDVLFAGSHDGKLHAINIIDGNILWTRNFKGAIIHPPRSAGDFVYQFIKSGKVLCLSASNGDTLWDVELAQEEDEQPVFCVSENNLFMADLDCNVLAVEAFTGSLKHKIHLKSAPGSDIISAHKYLYLVLKDGRMVSLG